MDPTKPILGNSFIKQISIINLNLLIVKNANNLFDKISRNHHILITAITNIIKHLVLITIIEKMSHHMLSSKYLLIK